MESCLWRRWVIGWVVAIVATRVRGSVVVFLLDGWAVVWLVWILSVGIVFLDWVASLECERQRIMSLSICLLSQLLCKMVFSIGVLTWMEVVVVMACIVVRVTGTMDIMNDYMRVGAFVRDARLIRSIVRLIVIKDMVPLSMGILVLTHDMLSKGTH